MSDDFFTYVPVRVARRILKSASQLRARASQLRALHDDALRQVLLHSSAATRLEAERDQARAVAATLRVALLRRVNADDTSPSLEEYAALALAVWEEDRIAYLDAPTRKEMAAAERAARLEARLRVMMGIHCPQPGTECGVCEYTRGLIERTR